MKEHAKPVATGFIQLLLTFLLVLIVSAADAQTVSGTVSDESGKKLSSVSVTVKGTTAGTTTGADGQYSINAASNATLVISSVGYATMDVPVGGRSVVDVTLLTAAQSLEAVVITALGITKQARGLGYSATNVKSDELTINRTPNVMNALQGKIAGVNISSLGTGPGGTSKIRIRGQSSIGGQNSPLIVINGVPIDNNSLNSSADSGGSAKGYTGGVKGCGGFTGGRAGCTRVKQDDK